MNNIKQFYQVAIRCMTYNQSRYIKDAMNGFITQQTNFPFVCMIIDDASTDGEQEVIKKYVESNFDFSNESVSYKKETDYAQIMYAQHKINRNCYFAVLFLKENHYSKTKSKISYLSEWRDCSLYEAICEGDDFWIDSTKLQKQKNILDQNKNCSLVLSNGIIVDVIDSSFKKRINPFGKHNTGFVKKETLIMEKYGMIPTASMMYRTKDYEKPLFFNEAPVGDRPLRMWLMLNGDAYYFDEPMTIYRRHTEGSFGQKLKNKEFAERIYKQMVIFFDKYNQYTNFKYEHIVNYLKEKELYEYYIRIGDRFSVMKCSHFRTFRTFKKIKYSMKTFMLLIIGKL